MELYDELIEQSMALLKADPDFHKLAVSKKDRTWPQEESQRLIFQKESAYELGGSQKMAISGAAFTTKADFESGIWLLGPDLSQIKEDASYARLTILNVRDDAWKDKDEAYRAMERMEYTRYHVYPKGFMIRISISAKREPVRVSKKALQQGLNFAKVGSIFIDSYQRHPDVIGVKQIFVTKADFPFEKLQRMTWQMEKVTGSLNKIFKDLIMDCGACNLKEICDEVEGLRNLHQHYQ